MCRWLCVSTTASTFMSLATPPFGDQAPGCEPYWYQGFHSPYYNASHVELRANVRAFVDREIRPHLDDWIEKKQTYPQELHVKAAALGFPINGLVPFVKERYPKELVPKGGFDAFHELIYLDELASVGPGGAMGQCGINSMAIPPVLSVGSKHVQDLVVDSVFSGAKNISLAISEPTAGSDVANIKLTAERRGDGFVLNGQKKWITGGHMASYFTLVARTGGAGPQGISLFLVDAKSPGIDVRKMETQFDTCHGTTFLTFDNVVVPAVNMIGEEGKGFKYILLNFNHERWVISVSTCRMSRLCYAEGLKYALRRKTFGKALAEHQIIRGKLAEMSRSIESLQDSLERIAYQYTQGIPDSRLGRDCALLKVMASKTFEHCAREASQIFGGASIVREGPGKLVERLYREVRASAIPGGSEEILLDLAARQAIGVATALASKAKL